MCQINIALITMKCHIVLPDRKGYGHVKSIATRDNITLSPWSPESTAAAQAAEIELLESKLASLRAAAADLANSSGEVTAKL